MSSGYRPNAQLLPPTPGGFDLGKWWDKQFGDVTKSDALSAAGMGLSSAASMFQAWGGMQQRSAMEGSMLDMRRAAMVQQRQVAQATAQQHGAQIRQMGQVKGNLASRGIESDALNRQATINAGRNVATIEANFRNQLAAIRAGYDAQAGAMADSAPLPGIDVFTGAAQGGIALAMLG